MARRFTLEGAKVEAVVEIMPYPAGLARNIAQCLEDFDIPLYLSSTVTAIHGKDRVEGVTVSQVDEKWQAISNTDRHIPCDTLLLSVGLIPENELSQAANVPLDSRTGGAIVDENRETLIPGIFACGNVLHVHDLVDYVSEEAEIAGKAAAHYALQQTKEEQLDEDRKKQQLVVKPGENVRYVLPQRLTPGAEADLFLRVTHPMEAITLSLNGITLARKRQVRPSEMLKIKLQPNHWDSLGYFEGELQEQELCLEAKMQQSRKVEKVGGARK